MRRPDIRLAALESIGPRELVDEHGRKHVYSRSCLGCGGEIERGEWIAKVNGPWLHRDCAEKQIDSATVRNAWALIGMDVARRPRAYTAREVRTVVEHLVQIVYERQFDDDEDRT